MKEKSPMKTTSIGCLLDEQNLVGPLFFAEMYEGNLHFSSSSSCKTVQTKNTIPSTVHKSQWVAGGVLLGF